MSRMPARLVRLLIGLFLYGFTMAMMVESTLGLDPWDVFHEGLAHRLPLTFGQVVIVVGALVLLLWLPLRQWPGIGTVLNVDGTSAYPSGASGCPCDGLHVRSLWV